jgi:hypothetical protein
MLKTKSIIVAATGVLAFGLFSFKGDKDVLNKKIYTLQVNEMKDGQPKSKKPMDDELEFKDGKVFSNILFDKHEFKWMKYKVTKDSTYEDEGEQKHWIEAESSSTNEKDETVVISIKVDNFDVDGTYKLTKHDLPKKLYQFIGKEKAKKK